MILKQFFIAIGVLITMALLPRDTQAKDLSIMADIDFTKVTLWYQYRRDVQIGIGADIENENETPLSPILKYYIKRIDDLKLFVSIEAEDMLNNGDNNNDDSGLDLNFGLGGEYFIQRNFSIVVFVAGGGGINVQYYF